MTNREIIELVRDITVAALNGHVVTDKEDTINLMQNVYDKLNDLQKDH